ARAVLGRTLAQESSQRVLGRGEVDDDRQQSEEGVEKNVGGEQAGDEVGDPGEQEEDDADDAVERTETRHGGYLQRSDSTERCVRNSARAMRLTKYTRPRVSTSPFTISEKCSVTER